MAIFLQVECSPVHLILSPGAPQWAGGAGGAGTVGLNVFTRTARLKEAEGVPKVTELVAK